MLVEVRVPVLVQLVELDELESSFREWNASVEPDGRVVPNIARV